MLDIRFRSPILVTGIPRSGTTFIGQLLSLSNEVIYFQEPFRTGIKANNENGVFDYWFQYIDMADDNMKTEFVNYIKKIAKLNISDIRRLKQNNFKQIANNVVHVLKKVDLRKKRILLKDPIAFFSAEWLYKQFEGLKVIVTQRNPVDFVSSFVKLGWDIGFDHIENQELLMSKIPEEYKEQVRFYALKEGYIVEKCILLWNIIYSRILFYKENYPNWKYIKIEDYNDYDSKKIENIFNYCGISYRDNLKKKIHTMTTTKSNKSWIRNTKSTGKNKVLNDNQIEQILTKTEKLRHSFGY